MIKLQAVMEEEGRGSGRSSCMPILCPLFMDKDLRQVGVNIFDRAAN